MTSMADASHRRWYRVTPGRLLPVLLAVEGFLWLSDWLRWLPKGYAVLIAIAAVGLFFLAMLGWFVLALLFRWRFQYGLLSLLVLTLAVALPFGRLATEMKQAKRQRDAVEGIRKLGQVVLHDYEADLPFPSSFPEPPGPDWLRDLLGDDFLANVTEVDGEVDDAGLVPLKEFTQLETLVLRFSELTDAGMEHLKGLTELRTLNLSDTKVTDVGLKYLRGLTRLE
jgi:hypothetical protein